MFGKNRINFSNFTQSTARLKVLNEQDQTQVEKPFNKSASIKEAILAQLQLIPRAFGSRWLWTAWLLTFLMLGVAYQFDFTKKIDLEAMQDQPYMIDYHGAEHSAGLIYRWTKPSSNVVLMGSGQVATVRLKLSFLARPANTPPANVRVAVNSNHVTDILVDTPRKTLETNYSVPNRSIFTLKDSEINLWLTTDALKVKGDSRSLGVAVSSIEIEGQGFFSTGRFTIPDWKLVLMVLGTVGIVFGLGYQLKFSPALLTLGTVAFAGVVGAGLIIDRPSVGLDIPLLWEGILLSYPLAWLGIGFCGWWLKRRSLEFSRTAAALLGFVFMFAFVIRVIGLNHPAFQVLDHKFRVHEIIGLYQNPSDLFARYYHMNSFQPVGQEAGRSVALGQWNLQVAVPYTPLFYLVAMPLVWLSNANEFSLLHWTNVLGAWLDVSSLFFLYLLSRQILGRYGEISGVVAGLLSCFFPLAYLMVSDGGYNTMLATWLSLAWLVNLSGWFGAKRPPSWKQVVRNGVLLALAFLAHTATLLILGTLALLYLLLLLALRKRHSLPAGWLVRYGVALLIGGGLAFGLYYGFYALALIQTTLPTIANKLGQGSTIGTANLQLKGFWPTLIAHFHLLPFLATVITLGGLLARLFRKLSRTELPAANSDNSPANYQFQAEQGIKPEGLVLLISWLITFLLFSVANNWINLLQKEMLFGLPLLALGTGLTLALVIHYLQRQYQVQTRLNQIAPTSTGEMILSDVMYSGLPVPPAKLLTQLEILSLRWGGWLLLALVVSWFLAAGTYTWYIRAINYVLPAGTG